MDIGGLKSSLQPAGCQLFGLILGFPSINHTKVGLCSQGFPVSCSFMSFVSAIHLKNYIVFKSMGNTMTAPDFTEVGIFPGVQS